MPKIDLTYPAILKTLGEHYVKQRTESRALLAWFLDNYYRLDPIEAADCICDDNDDRGIDGIYVNDQLAQIDVCQSRIVTKDSKTQGDKKLREFAGTLGQFSDTASVISLASTCKNKELVALLTAQDIAKKVADGYAVRGIYVTNAERDQNAIDFLATCPQITLFDALELEHAYVSIDKTAPIASKITFDLSGVPHMKYDIGTAVEMVVAPLAATELVQMDGITNGELFAYDVRQWLSRKTKVNKDIEKSIREHDEHKLFPAFHNGLTVLCEHLELTPPQLTISGYAVVNGCQSLSGLYDNRTELTGDLRILTKILKVSPDSDLARKIADHTNNLNGISNRDLQSNNPIQVRLQSEIHAKYLNQIYYRIKRGEHQREWPADRVIENELAARILLAFDLEQPWACHQYYRLFEELHSAIFGRAQVDADRIVIEHDIYLCLTKKLETIQNQLFGEYGLTPFVALYLVREALETDAVGKQFCANPSEFLAQPNGRSRINRCIDSLSKTLMQILDTDITGRNQAGAFFDYKRELKVQKSIYDLRRTVIGSYQVVVVNKYAPTFAESWDKSATPEPLVLKPSEIK